VFRGEAVRTGLQVLRSRELDVTPFCKEKDSLLKLFEILLRSLGVISCRNM